MQRLSTSFLVAALLVASGCASTHPSGPPGVHFTDVADTTFTVDRVGPGDGSLAADGVPDAVFTAEVEGPVTALILSSVDPSGAHFFDQVWDTLPGDQPFPPEIGAPYETGGRTIVLGVEENGVMLNRADGSLPPLGAGPHALTLYASPVSDLVTIRGGYHYHLTAVLEDGALVHGPVVTHP